ncbi:IS1 family transposase [Thiolinea disciformis]
MNPLPIQALAECHEVELVCEMDEQWSYMGHKKQPRWLWPASYPT